MNVNKPEEHEQLPYTGPRFIVFEGGDGSGKSALADTLCAYVAMNYPQLEIMHESFPGRMQGTLGEYVYRLHHNRIPGAPSADAIDPVSLQLLHVAAHIDTIKHRILPTLANPNGVVILDRYWWSTYAYSRYLARLDTDQTFRLLQAELMHWEQVPIKPVIVFVQRTRSLKDDYNEEGFARIRKYYEEIMGNTPDIVMLDNNDTFEEAWETLLQILGIANAG